MAATLVLCWWVPGLHWLSFLPPGIGLRSFADSGIRDSPLWVRPRISHVYLLLMLRVKLQCPVSPCQSRHWWESRSREKNWSLLFHFSFYSRFLRVGRKSFLSTLNFRESKLKFLLILGTPGPGPSEYQRVLVTRFLKWLLVPYSKIFTTQPSSE